MGTGTSQVLRMLAAPAQRRAADSLIICGCWERLACVSLVGCGGRSGVGLEWGGMSVFGVSRMLLVAGNSCVFGVLLLAACPCAAALGRAPGAGAPARRGPPGSATRSAVAPRARGAHKSPHTSHNNKGRQSFSDERANDG